MLRSTATPFARALSSACARALVERAVAGRGDDDSGNAAFDQQIDGAAVGAGDGGDDLDPRPRCRVLRQGCQADRGGRGRPTPQAVGAVPRRPAPSGPGSPDGTRRAAMDATCARRALSGPGRRGRRRRPDRRAPRRRSRRPDCAARRPRSTTAGRIAAVRTTGLVGIDNSHQEIGRLLERVGAVRDDDAAHLRPRQVAANSFGEPAPDREVHVLAVDLGHLFALADELAVQRWQRGQQLLDRQHRRGVGDVLVGRARASCDRAARAEYDDGPRSALHFRSNWMKIQGWIVCSAHRGSSALPRKGSRAGIAQAHRSSATDPRPRAKRDRAHRRAAHPGRDRQRARFQVGQRRRGASAGAGEEGRDRAGRRHVARHSSAV